MKKVLLATLILASTSTQVLANHHKETKHVPSAEKVMAHAPMRQQRMQELFNTGEMSVALMAVARDQMEVAIKKKDHSAIEKALQTFQAARELHKPNMKAMQKLSNHLQEHVADVKAGKIALTPEQAQNFEKEVTLFVQQAKAFKADCHENVRPKNKAMRKAALAFLTEDFAAAKKANQPEKMVHIAKIMQLLPPFKAE